MKGKLLKIKLEYATNLSKVFLECNPKSQDFLSFNHRIINHMIKINLPHEAVVLGKLKKYDKYYSFSYILNYRPLVYYNSRPFINSAYYYIIL